MTWVEVVQWHGFGGVAGFVRAPRGAAPARAVASPVAASVPVCRCGGECRCGTLVPYLLQRQIEMECEFFRDVH